jgi:pimeloyl-ACP methyl ester carboxylesterase
MRFGPPVRFTIDPNGSRLAYQVLGEGEHDLVFLLGWPTHLGLMWENPAFADFLHGLASFSRLIVFDHLGRGLSDRGPNGRPFEDGWTTCERSCGRSARMRPPSSAVTWVAGWLCCSPPPIRSTPPRW